MTRRSPDNGCLRNRTSRTGRGFLVWAADEAERSPLFRGGVDRLRGLAAGASRGGYPRTTGPLTGYEWAELEETAGLANRTGRPRAWRNVVLPTDDGLRHLRDYLRGCRALARRYLNDERAAPLVHDLVRKSDYRLEPPAESAVALAPTNGAASSLAAYITGASWGTAPDALRKQWNRARPDTTSPLRAGEFKVMLDPGSII